MSDFPVSGIEIVGTTGPPGKPNDGKNQIEDTPEEIEQHAKQVVGMLLYHEHKDDKRGGEPIGRIKSARRDEDGRLEVRVAMADTLSGWRAVHAARGGSLNGFSWSRTTGVKMTPEDGPVVAYKRLNNLSIVEVPEFKDDALIHHIDKNPEEHEQIKSAVKQVAQEQKLTGHMARLEKRATNLEKTLMQQQQLQQQAGGAQDLAAQIEQQRAALAALESRAQAQAQPQAQAQQMPPADDRVAQLQMKQYELQQAMMKQQIEQMQREQQQSPVWRQAAPISASSPMQISQQQQFEALKQREMTDFQNSPGFQQLQVQQQLAQVRHELEEARKMSEQVKETMGKRGAEEIEKPQETAEPEVQADPEQKIAKQADQEPEWKAAFGSLENTLKQFIENQTSAKSVSEPEAEPKTSTVKTVESNESEPDWDVTDRAKKMQEALSKHNKNKDAYLMRLKKYDTDLKEFEANKDKMSEDERKKKKATLSKRDTSIRQDSEAITDAAMSHVLSLYKNSNKTPDSVIKMLSSIATEKHRMPEDSLIKLSDFMEATTHSSFTSEKTMAEFKAQYNAAKQTAEAEKLRRRDAEERLQHQQHNLDAASMLQMVDPKYGAYSENHASGQKSDPVSFPAGYRDWSTSVDALKVGPAQQNYQTEWVQTEPDLSSLPAQWQHWTPVPRQRMGLQVSNDPKHRELFQRITKKMRSFSGKGGMTKMAPVGLHLQNNTLSNYQGFSHVKEGIASIPTDARGNWLGSTTLAPANIQQQQQ